ncbi:hypothetical protein DJ84_01955, partial [Halorubrum ezzemoulense]
PVAGLRETAGASSTLTLAMEDPPSPEVVKGNGVSDVTVRGKQLRVTCTDSRAKAQVVARLVERGYCPVDVGSEEASLGEIYGEYLRDGSARDDGETVPESESRQQEVAA